MRRRLVIVGLLLCAAGLCAQGKPAPATPEDVQKLLVVMRIRQQMESMEKAMIDQGRRGTQEAVLEQFPKATPELLDKASAIFGDSFREVVSTDEFVNAVVPIYEKYFTHDDVVALLTFYSSPTGQHFLDIMPQMLQDAAKAGGDVVLAKRAALQSKIEQRQRELLEYVRAHPELTGESPSKSPKSTQEESSPKK